MRPYAPPTIHPSRGSYPVLLSVPHAGRDYDAAILANTAQGQHSLEIFCLGVFLSFAAHFAMVEVSGAFWMQALVSALGILVMVAAAGLLTWYKRAERSSGSRPRKTPDADLAGGEA